MQRIVAQLGSFQDRSSLKVIQSALTARVSNAGRPTAACSSMQKNAIKTNKRAPLGHRTVPLGYHRYLHTHTCVCPRIKEAGTRFCLTSNAPSVTVCTEDSRARVSHTLDWYQALLAHRASGCSSQPRSQPRTAPSHNCGRPYEFRFQMSTLK